MVVRWSAGYGVGGYFGGGGGMVIIGIDPDMIASGFAVVVDGKIKALLNVPLPDVLHWVGGIAEPGKVVIKLEDVEANKGLFASRQNKNKAVSIKIAMSVGKVQATTHHIREILESAGYTVKMVKPLTGAVKKQAKADYKYFNKVTGWAGRSNADQRDAAMIALWG